MFLQRFIITVNPPFGVATIPLNNEQLTDYNSFNLDGSLFDEACTQLSNGLSFKDQVLITTMKHRNEMDKWILVNLFLNNSIDIESTTAPAQII